MFERIPVINPTFALSFLDFVYTGEPADILMQQKVCVAAIRNNSSATASAGMADRGVARAENFLRSRVFNC